MWLWLPFPIAEKSHSEIFKLLKPLKILWMFIYPAIKQYKELWRVEDRTRSGCLKSVRAEAAIKMVREQICWNPLWKQKIMSRKLNISTQSRRALSGTIYTSERTFAQRDTALLLFWRKSDGQEQNVSSSGTPRTGTKNPLHGGENVHHRAAVWQPEQQDLCSNVPWGAFWGCREAITLPTSWFGGRCPIRGWHLHFCKKGVKLVSKCIKRTCYKKLWNSLTRCRRVTQICAFNTVKLGTSASSP